MTDEAAPPLLRVDGVGRDYRTGGGLTQTTVRALDSVSFNLAAGEVLAVVGESGSGKSTLARVLARLEAPSRGAFEVAGVRLDASAGGRGPGAWWSRRGELRRFRGLVQMIFQDPFASLNPVKSVAHHLERPLLLHQRVTRGEALEQAVDTLLARVGLTPPREFAVRKPHQLSGGQRQRIAIARALAARPRLVLADEPTSMLDVSLRVGVLNLMAELTREEDLALVFITHDLVSARYLADRILVLYAGQTMEMGPSERILQGSAHPYTRRLLDAMPGAPRSTQVAAEGLERSVAGATGSATADPRQSAGCAYADRCPRAEARCRSRVPELEEVHPGHTVRCFLPLIG